MKNTVSPSRLWMERLFARFGLGMRAKLISLFVCIKVVPLILLAIVAWRQSLMLGEELRERTTELTQKANTALSNTGNIAVSDAVSALDERAREDIERMTTDTAYRVADFLYARDSDILFVAGFEPTEDVYRRFVTTQSGRLIKQGDWVLAEDGKSWQPGFRQGYEDVITSSIEENNHSFNYRLPDYFTYESRPLYLEMTFVDLNGQERIKVTTSPLMDPALKDVSKRENTFVKAETYFPELKKLAPGEIYVSEVIGAYTPSRVIGIYTPERAEKLGIPFEPEKEAYAGKENPLGNRFKGLVRWATPLVEKGEIIGYVTLALDHDHLMEFTSHLVPTTDRYTEVPDAYEGNYAFIWDHKGRSIVHPRHHSITGYDPETGDPQVPWLEDRIYDEWQASGKSYADFIVDVPTFVDQSNTRKSAKPLTDAGLVGLDCRYLNFAPQCTGWFDLTEDGGSGSFRILWSGLWKLNTAAAIPYYTGQYADSLRGFGFVTIGAGLEFFHRPAMETQQVIDTLIKDSDRELKGMAQDTQNAIDANLLETASTLAVSTGLMGILVVFIAIWMASVFTRSVTTLIKGISRFRQGERQFRFNAPIKDEIGALADSFDEMADSIVESVQSPMVITDLQKKILYMNDSMLSVLGKTLSEMVGTPLPEDVLFPAGTHINPIQALAENREADVMYHAPTGRYFRGDARFLTHSDGRAIGYIITTTDLTEIVNGQKQVEHQRALLDTIFSSSPDLIWYKEKTGAYLAVNPRFASLAGVPADTVPGRSAEDMFPPDRAKEIDKLDNKAAQGTTPMLSEEQLFFADGHTEIADVVRTPIFDGQGMVTGILGVARDVSKRVHVETELRETQQELEKTADEANRANASKSEFLARMSHEIRTPMNAIIGLTNITRKKLESPTINEDDIKSHLRQIETSSQHLLGLLNDVLDISKIEAGKIILGAETFDLTKLIDNVATIIRPRCTEKNITFAIEVENLSHAVFVSDPLRIRQVLINLLGNAVKFTPECGTVSFRVSREESRDGKGLLSFSIGDTGIGIDDAMKAKLFKPFEQADAGISRQFGGTGLGLSISQSIVKLLGGEISAQSTPGEGSTFSFQIWLPEGVDDRGEEEKTRNLSVLEGKRILLVDDVDINRIIVVELLNETGLIIEEAADGQAALDMFVASPPNYYDAILMDIQMPVLDGYAASAAIRALPRDDAATVAIIAMTANAFKEDVEKAREFGMNTHLPKPLELERLLETLIRYAGS
ncbi:PAS domain-containing protein [Desulfovibrio sp. OttesenSCG-928-I05]|nr:PAS domain-containing protein [Desulfovibrio sp. OttesenSCG-928-I05]